MKKIFTLFLVLVATTALWAYDFKVDGICYDIWTEDMAPRSIVTNNEVVVTYSSTTNNYPYLTTTTIPETVTYNGITYTVVGIWNSAFANCSSLESIEIPNSVDRLGEKAFYNTALTSIHLPKSVRTIYPSAFENCKSLYSVNIECEKLTSYGKTFSGCTALESVVWNVKKTDSSPFSGNATIKSFTFGESVEIIPSECCRSMSKLTSITIPTAVTQIGESAFENCTSLSSITIGDHVERIGQNAFTGTAFYNNTSNWDGNVLYLTNYLIATKSISGEYNIKTNTRVIAAGTFSDCSTLTSVNIPNTVVSIGYYSFNDCTSLTSIKFPNSITYIGGLSFYGCTKLKTIEFSEGLVCIDDYLTEGAFQNCSSLTSITFPASLKSIGYGCFDGCTSLESITCLSTNPPIVAFPTMYYNFNWDIPVYVPCGTVDVYANTDWKQFINIQEPTANYTITVSSNIQSCSARVDKNTVCGALVSATPSYGYHFAQWSDGSKENPYSLLLTQDHSLTAEFAPNQYVITTRSSDLERGETQGDKTANYLDFVTISAIANYGYYFSKWNDGNTDNQRTVQVIKDTTYTAYFEKNTYAVALSGNSEQGTISGPSSAKYLDEITISATANYGYHFTKWSDGNTNNPRTLVVTQDTTLTAEFAPNQYRITTNSADPERGTTQGDTTVNYLDYASISATANYGYYFSKWNDGNTDNLRTIQVTKDIVYTAYFEKKTYAITLSGNSERGTVSGFSSAKYLDEITVSATANYGYHFTQWSDGNTDNPRTIVVTQDTTLTAEFAPNQYTITTQSTDKESGYTQGDTIVDYLEYITISATANYGYYFSNWNDGNTDNPRVIQVTNNARYTAYFEKHTYRIRVNYDNNKGSVSGKTSARYLEKVTLSAIPKCGYHFTQWGDGNTDNPRTLVLTQDTIFTAEFAQSYSGQCGDNLYWTYNEDSKKISITGSGKMYDYTKSTQPWLLFQDQITEVTTSNPTTSIGTSAFEGCIRLGKVSLGYGMENIAANAFAECKRLYDIYVYATYPPFAEESSFANYNVDLYIPCESKRDYEYDIVWGKFKYIECIGAESDDTGGDDIVITPGSTDVTITWPTDPNAETYVIVIKQGDKVFCSLTFNADGMLLNIAFAPSRSGSHPVTYAASTGNGLRFTVTSLDAATTYGYDITTKDDEEKILSTYTGEFTTKSNVSTSVSDIQSPMTDCQKLLRNGQLVIVRDGKTYNAMGVEM